MKAISILIVEDDFLNSRSLKKALLSQGYKVFEARNTTEAKLLLRTEETDLIILDINLGTNDIDGVTLGGFIREKYDLPFIYITAYETAEIVSKAVGTAPLAYLTKPFKGIDVITAVELAVPQILMRRDHTQIIILKEDDYYIRVPIPRIDFIKSDGNYLFVNIKGKFYRCRSTIKQMMELLPADQFIQTHRAFIVNRNSIQSYQTKCFLINGECIPISKSFINDAQLIVEEIKKG